jgi:hypothetical protein
MIISRGGEKAFAKHLTFIPDIHVLFFFFHFSFIIHMCIQGLVHFSPDIHVLKLGMEGTSIRGFLPHICSDCDEFSKVSF